MAFLFFGTPLLGDQAVGIAHGLWLIDAAMSIASGLLIPYFMFTRQDHSMEKMTAVWLLPIVACEVAAASGGLLAPHLADADGFGVLIASYVLWALSVPLALSVLTILLLRLVVHSLPGRDMAASGWLAFGPIGTGGPRSTGAWRRRAPLVRRGGLAPVGDVAFGLGIIGGLVLWGYGVWWLLLAVMKTAHYMRGGMPFNLGWWGFTFPLGVYTLATLTLARITGLSLLSVVGGRARLVSGDLLGRRGEPHGARGVERTTLFVAPCLMGARRPGAGSKRTSCCEGGRVGRILRRGPRPWIAWRSARWGLAARARRGLQRLRGPEPRRARLPAARACASTSRCAAARQLRVEQADRGEPRG